jgi:hypothetical protein
VVGCFIPLDEMEQAFHGALHWQEPLKSWERLVARERETFMANGVRKCAATTSPLVSAQGPHITLDVSTGFTAPRLVVMRPLVLLLPPPVSAGRHDR